MRTKEQQFVADRVIVVLHAKRQITHGSLEVVVQGEYVQKCLHHARVDYRKYRDRQGIVIMIVLTAAFH
jgi:hypothetical protein